MEQTTDEMKKYCDQCGAAARPQARFCAGCGLEMTATKQTAMQPFMPEDPGLSQEAPPAGSPSMDLGMAWMIYIAALLLWIGTLILPVGPAFLPIYLVSGFVMTRYVMRGLIEFHPVHNTIANVFSAKLWMFLLWPIQMVVLLFKLTVNSAL